jgi:UDP-N-acetylglucosamine pyrophosphorylase
MKNRGVIAHMNKHNVKYIYLGPVDNVLLKVGDPLSLGYLVKNKLEIVSLFIKKRNPE